MSKKNYHGEVKVLASGSHNAGNLGFHPRSIFVSKSGKYVVLWMPGILQKSIIIKNDISDLGQYIKKISDKDGYVAPNTPSLGIAKFTIMQY